MIPRKGSFVKVCFNNGLVETGIVEVWNDKEIVLETQDSMIVINNPKDIFIFKVFKDKTEDKPPVSDVYVDKEMIPPQYHRDPVLRAQSLLELRKQSRKEERKRAREKLTEFKPTGNGATSYGDYAVLRDQSILRNTSEED